ncbi:hypothetical protein GLAREA_01444 [Glarea lozoyensis ATCC 20868]|uniref:Uncharacterized protein n=1 Tax=Glarea lozoyensis (strain ATCC 20868 / MF5171) TaxID=1116229 RepID=S3CG82_GLAL2|nr:uncharacterized protein GLAREA_01444 [Glarea lozoyensis ATCC 20868]EPE25532.1 hypothetical protein GLAREA_01444 [Glarea lozoyensis ATCC 20868]
MICPTSMVTCARTSRESLPRATVKILNRKCDTCINPFSPQEDFRGVNECMAIFKDFLEKYALPQQLADEASEIRLKDVSMLVSQKERLDHLQRQMGSVLYGIKWTQLEAEEDVKIQLPRFVWTS